MHDEAILVKGTGRVVSDGSPVTIEAVGKIYSSSVAVKGKEKFICADSKCGVAAIAVITMATKAGRKKSPSSYFRASPEPHVKGCTRRHSDAATHSTPLAGTNPASPHKAAVPTVWVSRESESGSSTDGAGAVPPTDLSTEAGSGEGRLRSGTGTSVSSSSKVEKFAKHWLDMTPGERLSTEFGARWNTGGTYGSAFWDLSEDVLEYRNQSAMRIYRGNIESMVKGTSGYSLTLSQRNSKDGQLRIWVQNATETSGPSGARLWKRLESEEITAGAEVFALGQFYRTVRPTYEWHSLAITNGLAIWIP